METDIIAASSLEETIGNVNCGSENKKTNGIDNRKLRMIKNTDVDIYTFAPPTI